MIVTASASGVFNAVLNLQIHACSFPGAVTRGDIFHEFGLNDIVVFQSDIRYTVFCRFGKTRVILTTDRIAF